MKNVHCMFHLRMATHGGVSLDNVHPFPVLEKAKGDPYDLYFMHNGIIQIPTPAGKSDTRVFAELYLQPTLKLAPELLFEGAYQDMVESLIGTSKLLFLDSNGRVVRLGSWAEKDGCYVSNTHSFQGTYSKTYQSNNSRAANTARSMTSPTGRNYSPVTGEFEGYGDGDDEYGMWNMYGGGTYTPPKPQPPIQQQKTAEIINLPSPTPLTDEKKESTTVPTSTPPLEIVGSCKGNPCQECGWVHASATPCHPQFWLIRDKDGKIVNSLTVGYKQTSPEQVKLYSVTDKDRTDKLLTPTFAGPRKHGEVERGASTEAEDSEDDEGDQDEPLQYMVLDRVVNSKDLTVEHLAVMEYGDIYDFVHDDPENAVTLLIDALERLNGYDDHYNSYNNSNSTYNTRGA